MSYLDDILAEVSLGQAFEFLFEFMSTSICVLAFVIAGALAVTFAQLSAQNNGNQTKRYPSTASKYLSEDALRRLERQLRQK